MENSKEEKGPARVLLGAVSSGAGKTTVTCGLLAALAGRGRKAVSLKCGPDYIDPMFHRSVLGIKSTNIDTFFCGRERIRQRLAAFAGNADLAVLEGVMGYYDGIGGTTVQASTYEVACATETPVILIVDAGGISLSVAAVVGGFLRFKDDSRIRGVIFNRMSGTLYERIRPVVERECGIRSYGYVPVTKEAVLQSRHLGLMLPEEAENWEKRLSVLAGIMEECLDIDGILELAGSAPVLENEEKTDVISGRENAQEADILAEPGLSSGKVRIAVSRDEAFCFCYDENLELLKEAGADIVFFSPMHDTGLPDADALLLTGGYPELHARTLAGNERMRREVREAVRSGMPCMAECGGFMYLHRTLEDDKGKKWEMAGVLQAETFPAGKRTHFGYITVTAKNGMFFGCPTGPVRGHEFHYYESTDCGNGCRAQKPVGAEGWECMHMSDTLAAGFPHLSYASNPETARAFVQAALKYRRRNVEV